jgi:DNA-binding NtrC family response regulator
VRVIAATNKNLEEQVRRGAFREDLYFRLAVLSLRLPPLRERTEDIPALCEHFLGKYAPELNKPIRGVTAAALERLAAYDWPGNVRELENVVYEAMVMAEGEWLGEAALPLRIRSAGPAPVRAGDAPAVSGPAEDRPVLPLKEAVQGIAGETEKEMILEALRHVGGNRTRAAAILGISRKTLFNKMTLFRIRWPE